MVSHYESRKLKGLSRNAYRNGTQNSSKVVEGWYMRRWLAGGFGIKTSSPANGIIHVIWLHQRKEKAGV